LNEEYYLSANAPPFVLFALSPIDRRLPALEDARLFRHVLAGYDLVAAKGPILLLRSNGHRPAPPRLLRQGTAHPGEPIHLEEYGSTNLWLEITISPSLAGRARQLLFKPPFVRLGVWRDAGQVRPMKFRAPPPMLAAGFVASPLLLTTADVQKLYEGGLAARPAAYSVELEPGTERLWQDTISYRVYAIEDTR
jgi:hypothetical protein